jgi:hypothetical protein
MIDGLKWKRTTAAPKISQEKERKRETNMSPFLAFSCGIFQAAVGRISSSR